MKTLCMKPTNQAMMKPNRAKLPAIKHVNVNVNVNINVNINVNVSVNRHHKQTYTQV
jgi:hypothetical protein